MAGQGLIKQLNNQNHGTAAPGTTGYGVARRGKARLYFRNKTKLTAGRGGPRLGEACLGAAGHGTARHGEVFCFF